MAAAGAVEDQGEFLEWLRSELLREVLLDLASWIAKEGVYDSSYYAEFTVTVPDVFAPYYGSFSLGDDVFEIYWDRAAPGGRGAVEWYLRVIRGESADHYLVGRSDEGGYRAYVNVRDLVGIYDVLSGLDPGSWAAPELFERASEGCSSGCGAAHLLGFLAVAAAAGRQVADRARELFERPGSGVEQLVEEHLSDAHWEVEAVVGMVAGLVSSGAREGIVKFRDQVFSLPEILYMYRRKCSEVGHQFIGEVAARAAVARVFSEVLSSLADPV